MTGFQDALIQWYEANKRDLPWRRTGEPYKIWLSEIMCQQTQVATVIPYYERFLEKYPTVFDLAQAKEDDVYKLWEGLGYYSRAKRLMLCAREVVEKYHGVFPNTYAQMAKLPGIGPYTAGAVLSIAYHVKEAAIDGNVMRVYARLYDLNIDVGKADARKKFDPYVRQDLPENISAFNQGLMELGARVCTPTKPSCDACPIREYCEAYRLGKQSTLPMRTPKAKKKSKEMVVAFVEHDGAVMVEKRGTEGLLANLWGFPVIEASAEDDLVAWLYDTYGLTVTRDEVLSEKKHVFTHLIWHMKLVRFIAEEKVDIDDPEVHWTKDKAFSDYPLPTAFRKLL